MANKAAQPEMNIHRAISAIMGEMGSLGKEQKNMHQRYNFRGVDDVYNHLQRLLAKHEVYSVPEVLEERSEERKSGKGGALIYRILKIKYTFWHSSGTSVECVVIGEGMDSGDKASNKAMSVAHKYAYFQVFTIPTKELNDPDHDSHEVLPRDHGTFSGSKLELEKLNTLFDTNNVPVSMRPAIVASLKDNATPLLQVRQEVLNYVKEQGDNV